MKSEEIRKLFLIFFKKRGHVIVPSSPLIPDDLSVLLTTAGMQQFKKYFTGELNPLKDFGSKDTVSIQKCFRTSDIDEVGDESHLTFFEMLGHFSFGDYFKRETINWTFELLTSIFGINSERISATVFEGDPSASSGQVVPFDEESFEVWSKLLPKERIGKGGRESNFWGPAGNEGPCGACNEVYVDGIEVATLVFMEYYCHPDKRLESLTQKGVDVGWGFERLAVILQETKSVFETDLFSPLMELLPLTMDMRTKRILADHVRGIAFLISDGVRPSNKEAGYILRRLMRRLMVHLHLAKNSVKPEHLLEEVFENYEKFYPELNREVVLEELTAEQERFQTTLQKGLKELARAPLLDARTAFTLYGSFGLPYEIIKELGGAKAVNLRREDFDEEFRRHQDVSRAGQQRKFGGHGLILDTGELKAESEEELKKVTRLHTATHLLNQALRDVLGNAVMQRGSDITTERTRFDFTFPRRMTPAEIKKVEEIVNEKIEEDLPVNFKKMPKEEAEKTGALHFFKGKYPDVVKIYYIGKTLETAYSKEFCGGPHVVCTSEIGKFKIIKEETSAAGIRRIRAAVE